MASTYYSGWTPTSIIPVTLKDPKLASRTSMPVPASTAPAQTVPVIPAAVASAAPMLSYEGIPQTGLTALQAALLDRLNTGSDYLVAPAITASAVQPGALFSLAGNSVFQNPAFGQGYYDVARSVATAQGEASEAARQQLAQDRAAKDAYYGALRNYVPGGPAGIGDRLNTLYNLNSQVGRDTARLLNSRFMTVGSGWGGGFIPGY